MVIDSIRCIIQGYTVGIFYNCNARVNKKRPILSRLRHRSMSQAAASNYLFGFNPSHLKSTVRGNPAELSKAGIEFWENCVRRREIQPKTENET